MLGVLYQTINWQTVLTALLVTFILVHVIRYVLDPQKIRNYPGPFLAKFTDVWLGWVSKNGHRSEVAHRMHQKYGESTASVFPLVANNHLGRYLHTHCPKPCLNCRTGRSGYHLRTR